MTMTEDAIKAAIKAVEIRHEAGWWVAMMPDIGVGTQAKTLPELGVEIERIIVAHFESTIELNADPFRCKHPSSTEELTETLNVVLAARTSTYASIASALREVERRLLASAAVPVANPEDVMRLRAEVAAAAAAVAAVAALVETPLVTKAEGN